MWPWQRRAMLLGALLLFVSALAAPRATLAALLAFLAVPFLCVIAIRALALSTLVRARALARPVSERWSDDMLPRYSVLVPLFHEAEVLEQLVAALAAIDYPKDRLQILLILESVDRQTRTKLMGMRLPANVSAIVVPDGQPRTKPRALNYALQWASGQYVVVYDAEDIPDPRQLRDAIAILAPENGRVGCVQARLGIYNARDGWLTRQFAIEYAALFDAILPALERLRMPVPLGGTSNHFPRAVLDAIGGWDPYNVTEDADLGIRLSRAGYEVRILNSTTGEEAPGEFSCWLRQRTRWLKGWMQTYLVHMRQPGALLRELGARRFLGLQVLMGGLILSTLVHPWFYVLALFDVALGPAPGLSDTALWRALWVFGLLNLVAGYATAVVLGWAAALNRGGARLAAHAALMPVYWLAISLAAYRALYQLVRDPYLWEKTAHCGLKAEAIGVPSAQQARPR
jgi:cellulose synthase/poly-beta-1,6-N-acetylglucosamine synthase-like glycosyltransferase